MRYGGPDPTTDQTFATPVLGGPARRDPPNGPPPKGGPASGAAPLALGASAKECGTSPRGPQRRDRSSTRGPMKYADQAGSIGRRGPQPMRSNVDGPVPTFRTKCFRTYAFMIPLRIRTNDAFNFPVHGFSRSIVWILYNAKGNLPHTRTRLE